MPLLNYHIWPKNTMSLERMTDVDAYIATFDSSQRQLLRVLHGLVLNQFDLQAKIRYRIPFYYNKSWICYLNPLKKGGVELCFLRANELSNEIGWLDFKDRKQVAGITYNSVKDINETALNQILQEALILDESIQYGSKRKKK
ncbi:MAG: DUF1801 domain-containing protein [Reichenbachiella sp.]|uniref:DUF1801 domain-containing protein n=1 Tax=Reichenbachiella sp. TaxID=2184521 RepID=UPI003297870C